MKNVKIQYSVLGEIHEVILMRKEFAYQTLRRLRSMPQVSSIRVFGLDAEVALVKNAR